MTVATGDATINNRGEEVTFDQWNETADAFLVERGFNPLFPEGDGFFEANLAAMRHADEVHGVDSGIDEYEEKYD